jgi:hypothetical protein
VFPPIVIALDSVFAIPADPVTGFERWLIDPECLELCRVMPSRCPLGGGDVSIDEYFHGPLRGRCPGTIYGDGDGQSLQSKRVSVSAEVGSERRPELIFELIGAAAPSIEPRRQRLGAGFVETPHDLHFTRRKPHAKRSPWSLPEIQ